MVILFNKPYNVLCQFTDSENRQTLADFIKVKNVYAAGRLDKDSEGLVILTDDGNLQNRICDPKHKWEKTYWVQVEGLISEFALQQLRTGVTLKDGLTKTAKAKSIGVPDVLWRREPPIRERKSIPTSWLELSITEGKNRQIRRMAAALNFPVLRLIRYQIGKWTLDGIAVGEYKILDI